jgi:putative membrane protein
LSTIAAPLILLGAPALPLLYGTPRKIVVGGFAPVLRSRPMRAMGWFGGEPAFCWSVAVAAFISWHTPSLFQLGLGSEYWHGVEHASFFGSGLLFWRPVVQPWPSHTIWPRWSIPLYLFFAMLPCDVLSAFLAFSDRVVYPAYLSAPRHFGLSAIQDQECAGAIMWLSVTLAYAIPAAIITVKLLSPTSQILPERYRDLPTLIG